MKLYTVMLPLTLAIAYCCTSSQAVVHGIKSHSGHYEPANSSKDGYRYNGPAHKYLPAISTPNTEAVATAGHWQPSYEYPKPTQGLYQHGYTGPYSMQHYDRKPQLSSESWQQQQHEQSHQQSHQQQQQQQLQHHQQTMTHFNNNFQYAPTHKPTFAPTTLGQFSAAYGLSSGANHGHYMEPNYVDNHLITQDLPELNQVHMFAEPEQSKYRPQQTGSSYIQMQSQSFELPSYSNMHKEYPEQQQQQQQQYLHLQPHKQHNIHGQPATVQRPALQFRPDREDAYQYTSAQGQNYEHYSDTAQQHYVQPNSIFATQSHSPAFPSSSASASSSSSTSSSQPAHLAPPSREFLAPYY